MNEQQQQLLERTFEGLSNSDNDYFNSLNSTEKEFVIKILKELDAHGYSPSWNILNSQDFEQTAVDIETFIYDKDYLGLTLGKELYPRWLDHMKYYCDPHNRIAEVFFTGPIGAGKTSIAVASILYQIHKLLCLKNPQSFYNIITDDVIAFAFFNVVLTLAQDVTLNKVMGMINRSPFFLDHMPPKKEKKIMEGIVFKKNLAIMTGSRFTHGLGYNIFGGVIDEANFFKVGEDLNSSNIMSTYTGILRRMESRFMRSGGYVPGQLYIVSSKNETSSFLELHIESNKGNPRCYTIDEPIWEFRKHLGIYSGIKFKVMIGDQNAESKILTKIKQNSKGDFVISSEDELNPIEGYRVIEVPIEYGSSFTKNLNNSIRDIAGISTYGQLNLISNRTNLRRCLKTNIGDFEWKSPMKKDVFSLDFNSNNDRIMNYVNVGRFKDYLDFVGRGFPRSIHVDVGITGDALGFAMTTIHEMGLSENLNLHGEMQIDIEEKFRTELMFRILPEKGQQIPLMRVVNFIFELKRVFNLTINTVSFDGFQSAVLLQQLQQLGFKTKLISVDRTEVPYVALRDLVESGRIEFYDNKDLILELSELVHYRKVKKVDHPAIFSTKEIGRKDLADAVCGSVFSFLQMNLKEKSELKQYLSSAVDIYDNYERSEEDELESFLREDYMTPEERQRIINKFKRQ